MAKKKTPEEMAAEIAGGLKSTVTHWKKDEEHTGNGGVSQHKSKAKTKPQRTTMSLRIQPNYQKTLKLMAVETETPTGELVELAIDLLKLTSDLPGVDMIAKMNTAKAKLK